MSGVSRLQRMTTNETIHSDVAPDIDASVVSRVNSLETTCRRAYDVVVAYAYDRTST